MDILWGLHQATCGPQHWGATNLLEKLSYSHKLFNVSSGFRVELQDLGGKHLKMQVSLELPFKEFLKNVRVPGVHDLCSEGKKFHSFMNVEAR